MNQAILNNYMDGSRPDRTLVFPDPYGFGDTDRTQQKAFYRRNNDLPFPDNVSPYAQLQMDPSMVLLAGTARDLKDYPELTNKYSTGQPVLMDQTQPNNNTGILNQTMRGPQSNGVLAPQQNTGNMRGSLRVPTVTPVERQKIDMMSEGNMRMGGAGLGALGLGGNEAIAAAMSEYGAMKDYNRQAELDALAAEAEQAQALADQAKDPDEAYEKFEETQRGINDLDDMIDMLEQGGMTGLWDGTVKAWLDETGLTDKFTGNTEGAKKAYFRDRLENYRVSEALKLVAQTKGAISDREMNLFLSPVPTTSLTNEETWLYHLRERRRIAQKLQDYLVRSGGAPDTSGYSIVNEETPG